MVKYISYKYGLVFFNVLNSPRYSRFLVSYLRSVLFYSLLLYRQTYRFFLSIDNYINMALYLLKLIFTIKYNVLASGLYFTIFMAGAEVKVI